MLLSLCAASVVAVIMRCRQRRRKKRKIWTQEWLKNKTYFGAYYTMLAELGNLHVSSYRNFLCMDVTSFYCNLCHCFISHISVFVILQSYIIQTGKLLIKSDEFSGILKVPFENSLLTLFCHHVRCLHQTM